MSPVVMDRGITSAAAPCHQREDGMGQCAILMRTSHPGPAMRRLYPSTLELLAFETTARHMNMSRAAEELCVTQGAVSRQVLQLEHWLGVALFERVGNRLVLTADGQAYLDQVRPSLAALEQATLALRQRRATRGVTLSCAPTFGARWLIPRLPALAREHPDLQVGFCPFGQADASADWVIRYGEGVWPGLSAHYLGGRELSVVFAPQLGPLCTPGAVQQQVLLQHASLPHAWAQWCQANGLDDATGQAYHGPRFEQFSILIEAVMAGLGVGLVPTCLVERELAAAQVLALDSVTPPSWKGYYLTRAESAPRSAAAELFFAWLLREAQPGTPVSTGQKHGV